MKLDAQLKFNKITAGLSIRYNSFMQNIDSIFVSDIFTQFVPGIEKNRLRNNRGDLFIDIRFGYQIHPQWKVDFLIDNLLNREQMIRPAYLGPPRKFTLRVSYTLWRY
ncbi:MAG: hypothetical protein U5L96_01065 [Owenweeksia sp.]|nr:hypothetical protein [Owenweeksia sp.]